MNTFQNVLKTVSADSFLLFQLTLHPALLTGVPRELGAGCEPPPGLCLVFHLYLSFLTQQCLSVAHGPVVIRKPLWVCNEVSTEVQSVWIFL